MGVGPMMLLLRFTCQPGNAQGGRQELLRNQSGLSPGWTRGLLPPVSVSNTQTLTLPLVILGPHSCLGLPSATLSLTIQADKSERRLGLTMRRMGSQPEDGHLPCGSQEGAPSLPFLEVSVMLSPLCSPLKGATRPLTTVVWLSPIASF